MIDDEAFADIEKMMNQRPPRVKTRVLDCNGKTVFVPEDDIIDWEKKQKEDTISAAITVGATSVILLMAACLMIHIGSPRACLFVIGATLAACIGFKAYRIFRIKKQQTLS